MTSMTEENLEDFTPIERKTFLRRDKILRKESLQIAKHLETRKEKLDKQINVEVSHFKKRLNRTQDADSQFASGHNEASPTQTDRQRLKLPSIDRSKVPLQNPIKCGGRKLPDCDNKQRISTSPQYNRLLDSLKSEEVAHSPAVRRGSLPDPQRLKSFLTTLASKERDILLGALPSGNSGSRSAPNSPLLARRRQSLTPISVTSPGTPQNSPPISPHMPRNLALREQRRRESLRNSFFEDNAKKGPSLEEQFKALESCRYLRKPVDSGCESDEVI